MKNLLVAIALIFSLAVTGRTVNQTKTKNIASAYKYQTAPVSRERITMGALPKDARKYLKENFPIRQVREIYKVRENKETIYEVNILLEGKKQLVRFDSNGELIDL